MEWALHDPEHGAYGAGRLRVGPAGDFVTSPSLGDDFAALLAPQIAQWLAQLAASVGPEPNPDSDSSSGSGSGSGSESGSRALALIETGPGEGDLALHLAEALAKGWPQLAACTELVLVEPNRGMAERQRQRLQGCPLPLRWCTFEELAAAPVHGVALAHEVLDALAVERIEWDGALWRRQRVTLRQGLVRLEPGEPLEPQAAALLEPLGLLPPAAELPPGWCTELHPGLAPWLQECAAALTAGRLLVIDYALEARRYYALSRSGGTLMAYRGQRASADPLLEPGRWDLTAHLCLESLQQAAAASGWQWRGTRRQGEALLALGLAERLHGLQQGAPSELPLLLQRREALLRLVDPAGLGDFRWIAFGRQEPGAPPTEAGSAADLFLCDPQP
jgi:SAM-dependent MidA family methyltransferase